MSRLRALRDEIDALKKENTELKEALSDYRGAYQRSLEAAEVFRVRHEQEVERRIALEVEVEINKTLKELLLLTAE